MTFIDADFKATKRGRAFTFSRDKLGQPERLANIFNYIRKKLEERYGPLLASNIRYKIFEQDGSNFVMNKATVVFYFGLLEISKN